MGPTIGGRAKFISLQSYPDRQEGGAEVYKVIIVTEKSQIFYSWILKPSPQMQADQRE